MLGALVFFLFFVFCSFLTKYLMDSKSRSVSRFNESVSFQVCIYLTEIAFVFLIFQIVLHFFSVPLGYQEEGWLKRFIDFFTVYQILIFVLLKLYDSYKKDAETLLVFAIDLVEPYIDSRKFVPDVFYRYKETELYNLCPPNIIELFKEFEELLMQYEICLVDPDSYVESTEDIIIEIKRMRTVLNASIVDRESHWNFSILLRRFNYKD